MVPDQGPLNGCCCLYRFTSSLPKQFFHCLWKLITHVALMLRAWRPSVSDCVCPTVALVDCDHIVQKKVEIGSRHDRTGWWSLSMPNPTQIVASCDAEFYGERPAGYGKMWSFVLRRGNKNGASNRLHVALFHHLLSFWWLSNCWEIR